MVEEEERLLKVGEEFLRKPTRSPDHSSRILSTIQFSKEPRLTVTTTCIYIYIYGQTSPLRKEKGDTSDVNIMGIFDSGILVYR